MPDAILPDGNVVEFKTASFTLNNNLSGPRRPLDLPTGKFEVTGSMTAYFQSEALYRAMIGRPHKASIWQRARPFFYRTLAYGLLLAATMAFVVSGAH